MRKLIKSKTQNFELSSRPESIIRQHNSATRVIGIVCSLSWRTKPTNLLWYKYKQLLHWVHGCMVGWLGFGSTSILGNKWTRLLVKFTRCRVHQHSYFVACESHSKCKKEMYGLTLFYYSICPVYVVMYPFIDGYIESSVSIWSSLYLAFIFFLK